MKKLNFLFGSCFVFLLIGCQEEEQPQPTTNNNGGGNNNSELFTQGQGVTDIEGRSYATIVINGKEWMQENLAVNSYRNGDPIPTGLSDAAWGNLTSGAYSIYNNDAANNTTYGKLYNWYAVNDSRGLCPTGWHVPSDAEWTTLINYLDPNANGGATDPNVAGGKMKSTGTIENGDGLWNSPNEQATNESGFSGLPGGARFNDGSSLDIGTSGRWWSSTEAFSGLAWHLLLNNSDPKVSRSNGIMSAGASVRCVKD
jgi:uncharacterized protein (TIGR02145 family)